MFSLLMIESVVATLLGYPCVENGSVYGVLGVWGRMIEDMWGGRQSRLKGGVHFMTHVFGGGDPCQLVT